MDTNIILDLIKYFAKFPAKAGVLKQFARTTEKYSGYNDLKIYINALPDPILPDLSRLIISTDESTIQDNISNIESYFLMVEYGAIPTSSPNAGGVRESRIHLSAIIASKHNAKNMDMIEEALEMNKMAGMIQTLANQMISDSKSCSLLSGFNESSINMAPVEPAMIFGCIGWYVSFEKVSHTLFNG